jgi:hypothetical protein
LPVERAASTVVDPPAAGDCTPERPSAAQPPIHIEREPRNDNELIINRGSERDVVRGAVLDVA